MFGDRGAAFIEFVIVIPILILFLMFCFELGRVFNHYTLLSQVAYEGTRLGIQMIGMDPGCFEEADLTDLGWLPSDQAPAGGKAPHYFAQARVTQLLRKYEETQYLTVAGPNDGRRDAARGQPIVRSQFLRSDTDTYGGSCAPAAGGPDRNTFGVQIVADYEPLFFPIFTVPLRATSQGAFLFNNNRFFLRNNATGYNGGGIPGGG